MVSGANLFPITFIVGPTASGKSQFALVEAERQRGMICNIDSVQIYRGLDIGAAKPSPSDMARVPHALFDICNPDQKFTAGDYRRMALELIDREASQRPLFFVGGSGFYVQALEFGMFDVQKPSEETLRQIDEWSAQSRLMDELRARDPDYAAKISANDIYRIRRALEVCLTEGKSLTEVQMSFVARGQSLHERFSVKKIGILVDRDLLRERVRQRTKSMLTGGFIEETKELIARGYRQSKALHSVGYAQVIDFLEGRLSRADLDEAIVTATMQLAKRQMTWFRRDPSIEWRHP